jgi:hypothetical protein
MPNLDEMFRQSVDGASLLAEPLPHQQKENRLLSRE